MTFSSRCEACKVKDVVYIKEGECKKKPSPEKPTFPNNPTEDRRKCERSSDVKIQTICTKEYVPVCGYKKCTTKNCRGKEFSNKCMACANTSVYDYAKGKCPEVKPPTVKPYPSKPEPQPIKPPTTASKEKCTDEERKNKVCAEIFKPVCGIFKETIVCITSPCGKTFSNKCEACMSDDVAYIQNGKCDTNPRPKPTKPEIPPQKIDYVKCEKRQTKCKDFEEPVCGFFMQPEACTKPPCNKDSQEFKNSCEACRAKDVMHYTKGKCSRPEPRLYDEEIAESKPNEKTEDSSTVIGYPTSTKEKPQVRSAPIEVAPDECKLIQSAEDRANNLPCFNLVKKVIACLPPQEQSLLVESSDNSLSLFKENKFTDEDKCFDCKAIKKKIKTVIKVFIRRIGVFMEKAYRLKRSALSCLRKIGLGNSNIMKKIRETVKAQIKGTMQKALFLARITNNYLIPRKRLFCLNMKEMKLMSTFEDDIVIAFKYNIDDVKTTVKDFLRFFESSIAEMKSMSTNVLETVDDFASSDECNSSKNGRLLQEDTSKSIENIRKEMRDLMQSQRKLLLEITKKQREIKKMRRELIENIRDKKISNDVRKTLADKIRKESNKYVEMYKDKKKKALEDYTRLNSAVKALSDNKLSDLLNKIKVDIKVPDSESDLTKDLYDAESKKMNELVDTVAEGKELSEGDITEFEKLEETEAKKIEVVERDELNTFKNLEQEIGVADMGDNSNKKDKEPRNKKPKTNTDCIASLGKQNSKCNINMDKKCKDSFDKQCSKGGLKHVAKKLPSGLPIDCDWVSQDTSEDNENFLKRCFGWASKNYLKGSVSIIPTRLYDDEILIEAAPSSLRYLQDTTVEIIPKDQDVSLKVEEFKEVQLEDDEVEVDGSTPTKAAEVEDKVEEDVKEEVQDYNEVAKDLDTEDQVKTMSEASKGTTNATVDGSFIKMTFVSLFALVALIL